MSLMRARRVGVLGADETRPFTVTALAEAEPLAEIQGLWITCKQLDGTWKSFDILAGETPLAVPGVNNLRFQYIPVVINDIIVANKGATGVLYIRITDDNGVEIAYWERFVPAGFLCYNDDIYFDMPNRDYGLIIEVGH